jgi:hypothetical protein
MTPKSFVHVAEDLELAGLLWQPEMGDEIASRADTEHLLILVDSQGMTPLQLRRAYLWLPSVEQMVEQIEARQGLLEHSGLEITDHGMFYRTVVKQNTKLIKVEAPNLRHSFGLALRDMMLSDGTAEIH